MAQAIDRALEPVGVAVVIEAEHHCMPARGVRKPDARLVTRSMLGAFAEDRMRRREFEAAIRAQRGD